MTQEKRAPRFRAYLDHKFGALIMLNKDWQELARPENRDRIVKISILETPLAALSNKAKVVGSFVVQQSDSKSQIIVIREDQNDAPKYLNIDKYDVWEDLSLLIDIGKSVRSADTDNDSNFRSFLEDYVFITPVEKGIDHHLSEIPPEFDATLKNN